MATIVPQAVDTPIFGHAGNYTGHRVRPIPPVVSPDYVAEGIELCAETPKREVNYGRSGRTLETLYTLAPGLYRRLAHGAFVRGTMAPARAAPAPGNVLVADGPHQIDGEWRRRAPGTLRRAFLGAAAGGIAGLLGATAWAHKEDS